MNNQYQKLGKFIREVDVRNSDLSVDLLLGISIEKKFIPSHANTIGTDFKSYKIVKKGQFAYGPVTSRNGDKISIARLEENECLISSSYISFEIIDENKLNPDYLMLLFSNPEFDRFARYNSWGSAREIFSWDDLCNSLLYIPDITIQNKIVNSIKTVSNKIEKLNSMNNKILNLMEHILYNKVFNFLSLNDLDNLVYDDLPNGWTIKSLNECAECQSGYAFYKDGYDKDGIRIVDLGNININSEFIKYKSDKRVNINRIQNSKYEKFKLKKDDLLMVMTDRKSTMELLGKTGKVLDNEIMYLNQRVYRIRTKNNINYLYTYLNSEILHYYYMSNASGTAQKYLNNGDIDNIPVIVPDNDTLLAINNELNILMKKFEENVFKIEKLTNLEELLKNDF